MSKILLAATIFLVAASCTKSPTTPTPEPPATVDASDGGTIVTWTGTDPSSRACAKLQSIGCPLGNDPNCATTFNLPSQFGASAACVLAAANLAALSTCNVTCQ